MVEEKYAVLEIVPSFPRAIKAIEDEKPAAVLIDITLQGEKNGLDLAEYIRDKYHIPYLFLTANSGPAILSRIVALKPKGYLVKPVQKVNLITALDLLFAEKEDTAIFIKAGAQSHRIFLDNLLYAESDHVYVKLFFMHGKNLLLRLSLQNLIEQLPAGALLRISRSAAVNPAQITSKGKKMLQIQEKSFRISPNFPI